MIPTNDRFAAVSRPLSGLRGPVVALVTASLVGAALVAATPAGATPAQTVTATTTTQVAPNVMTTLKGLSLAGVSAGEVQATLSTTVGTIALPHHDNLVLSYNDNWSGDPAVTFTGTESNINAALESAALTPGDTAGQTARVSLTALPADADHVYLAPNQHFYEFVPDTQISWSAADAAAKQRTFLGQRGYLATIPNSTVNDFISSRIENAKNVWFGARSYHPDGAYPRVWRWTKGSDESPIAGGVISYCNSNDDQVSCSFDDNDGLYSSWAPGEPNNFSGEDYPVTNWAGSVGTWNDLRDDDAATIGGYIVEYGDKPSGATSYTSLVSASADVLVAGSPGAPSDVTAEPGNGSAAVSFTAGAANGSDVTSYAVTSAPGGATASCATTPCTVTGLTNGTAYTFTVVAVNGVGNSPPSSAADAVTPHTVPGAPTGVSATRGDATASVAFTAPADGGAPITAYTVTSSPGGLTGTCTASPCTVTGLTNGTGYTFTVVAGNVAGDSAPSSPSNSVTPATVPDAPTHVVATRGAGSASVIFDASAGTGGVPITKYTVTSSPGGKTATCDGVSACVVEGLTNGTAYTFTVTATNAVGESGHSTPSNAVMPATVPGAPSITSLTSNDGGLTVALTVPDNGADAIGGYEYSIDGTTWHALVTSGTGPFSSVISGLDNGTAYAVRVRAANGVGKGAASSALTATPATRPGSPTTLSARLRGGAVTVTWQPPADGGSPITGYVVTAAPGGATCVTTGATRCSFTSLPAGRAYTFTVRASNANGSSTATGIGSGETSSPSAATAVTGRASAPGRLRVVAGDRVLTIRYDAPTDDGGAAVTGYQVSIDGGRHWLRAASTRTVVAGVRNGKTFGVVVRSLNANGAGAGGRSGVVRSSTRQWFHDPVSERARTSERAVPGHPTRYRGRLVATRAYARSHNGTVAMSARSLRGRQLQSGQAASLATDALFAFDTATLSPAGKRQVRAIVRSLTYVHSVVCEGYADFGGKTAHQRSLSRQRATTFCQALRRSGAKVRMRSKGYGASRPVVIGGTPSDRAANRRVVLLITG